MTLVALLPRRRGRHRAEPGGPGWQARLVALALSAVVVQAFVVEPSGTAAVRHLDLPLAVATIAILAWPGGSAAVAVVCGLLVDAFGRRLFGVHLVAYAVIGPILQLVPVPSRIRPPLAVAGAAGLAGAAATAVVVAAQAVVDGAPPGGSVARVLGGAAWTAVLVGSLATRPTGPLHRLVR